MPPPNAFGPLPTQVPVAPSRENAKAAAAFLGLVTVARVFPAAAGPIARYGLGVEVAAGGGLGVATPLFGLNALPQPFGFVPAPNYGLSPNFYFPDGFGYNLPSVVPGASEQKLSRDEQIKARQDAQRDNFIRQFGALQSQRGSQVLQDLLQQIQAAPANSGFQFSDAAVTVLQGILAQRESQRAAANAQAAAQAVANATENFLRLPRLPQGPISIGQGGPGSTNPTRPGGPVIRPYGQPPGTGNQPRAPSGFVTVPPQGANAGGGTVTSKAGGYYDEFGQWISSNFVDTYAVRAAGDP